MNSIQKIARIVGVLFLTATFTYMLGSGLLESILNDPDFLLNVYPNKTQVIIGVLFEFINAAVVVGIGVLMLPILKQHNERIALGYLSSRMIEAVILIVSVISLLLLLTLSQEYIQAGTIDASYYQTLGALAIEGHYLAFEIAMVALSLGSLMFCYLLYTSKLIPQFIAVLGFIGYAALLTRGWLEILGYATGMILFLPGALFEIIFPVWLIVKGFNSTATAFESAKTDRNKTSFSKA